MPASAEVLLGKLLDGVVAAGTEGDFDLSDAVYNQGRENDALDGSPDG